MVQNDIALFVGTTLMQWILEFLDENRGSSSLSALWSQVTQTKRIMFAGHPVYLRPNLHPQQVIIV